MSRSAAQREAAVSRKRRQRDRERHAARLAAAAQAARQEAAEEKLAPAVMRQTITSTEGYMLTGPRVRIINGRPERDPIAYGQNPEFTKNRKWAARKFQLDWHDVGCGENVAAVDYLRSGGGSGAADGWPVGHHAMMEQVKARARLQGALAFLGAFAPGVCRVVLDGVPISAWVLEGDPPSTVAAGVAWIALGLDRLVLFYDPPSSKPVVIRTIGPPRADYTTEVGGESG
jgi:hypothetical protein